MTEFFLLLAIILLLIMGFGAFLSSPSRAVNQSVALLTLFMIWWLTHNLITISTSDSAKAILHIRWASIASGWAAVFAQIVRITITRDGSTLWSSLRQGRHHLLLGLLTFPLCLSPSFILNLQWSLDSKGNQLATPEYGLFGILFGCYLIGHIFLLTGTAIRQKQKLTGLRRVEINYLISAMLLASGLATLVGLLSNIILGTAVAVPLTNAVAATSMVAVITYGTTARSIMAVRESSRRLAAILLQLLILMIFYTAAFMTFTSSEFGLNADNPSLYSHLAAFVLAVLSIPLHQWILRLEGWIFSRDRHNIAVERLEAIQLILRQGATVDNMLNTFENELTRLLDIDHIMVYTKQDNHFVKVWPEDDLPPLSEQSYLIEYLDKTLSLISADHSQRQAHSGLLISAIQELKTLNMSLAIPSTSNNKLSGFTLFSPCRGKKIFTQDQLQFAEACTEQLEIGLNNVALFSQVEQANQYHQALIHHMAGGIMAVNPESRINVCNHKAQAMFQIPNLTDGDLNIEALPAPLPAIYKEALEEGRTPLHEFSLAQEGDSPRLLRCLAASFPVSGHDRPGVVMLMEDLTEMRKLEKSLQEKDGMARVGQLAAQMAHEIKNPLQTLQTFFDLYPDRKDDQAFTLKFADIAGTETQRINQIVDRLFQYLRHEKPLLKPLSLHDLLTNLSQVYEFRLLNVPKTITLQLRAEQDKIFGDFDQLTIVCDNIICNGLQAMASGNLTVQSETDLGANKLLLHISDQGEGIHPEDLPQIFNPFFSRKVYGTGLGLVNVKQIVEDHGGEISVESILGKGTTFHIAFPLWSKEGTLS